MSTVELAGVLAVSFPTLFILGSLGLDWLIRRPAELAAERIAGNGREAR